MEFKVKINKEGYYILYIRRRFLIFKWWSAVSNKIVNAGEAVYSPKHFTSYNSAIKFLIDE